MEIHCVGTIRSNRLQGCPLKSEKEMKAIGRGAIDIATDANCGITVVRWLDNRIVTATSTYVGAEPLSSVKR